ncbi:MAG: DUF1501 domain-containing protein [Planctomycetaceae bacterium]
MINLFPMHSHERVLQTRQLHRRALLKMGSLALGGAALPSLIQAREQIDYREIHERATAKNCIYIFLCGGPSQNDMWDLKPEAPEGIRTLFQPIETNVPGILFSDLTPQLAMHADKLAFIRSMTHSDNGHGTAIARTLHGMLPPRPTEEHAARDDHPGLGAILHAVLGSGANSLIPPWVILPRPFGTYSPPYKGQSGGFLGTQFDPVAFNKEPKGSLSDALLKLDAVQLLDGVTGARLDARNTLLQGLSETDTGNLIPATEKNWLTHQEQALSLLTQPEVKRAFDIQLESDETRDRYGRNEYGQSFLMARRLVESGVRMVNVFWTFFDAKGCQFNLWDCHGVPNDVCGIDGQITGKAQITHQYCTPSFDKCFSALLEDLDQRGLLDDTLVVVAGEFGRTPRINNFSGRDHWAHCYTQLMAGGGIRGGQVYGASDPQGAYVKDKPVTPDDFAATILYAFGISPEVPVYDRTGRPVRVTTGNPVAELFG